MIEKLIITLSEHVLWGPILQPVLVQLELTGAMSMLEIIVSKSTCFSKLNENEREIVALAERVSDKSLMKKYSKENNIVDFHKKVTQETIDRYIRPAIESSHRKIIDILKSSDVEMYLRINAKTRVFYDIDKIEVHPDFSNAVFNFKKDKDLGLRYFISLRCNDDAFDLFLKNYYTLCSEPAVLVINRKLHVFSDIDIKKLIPFFTKNYIEVPAKSEKTYIEKFVKVCVEKYEVISEGLEINEIHPLCNAKLTMDIDFNLHPVLNLNFNYNDKLFPIDSPNKKHVYVENKGGELCLNWFLPNKVWEKSRVDILLQSGLVQSGINCFSVNSQADIYANSTASLVEWLQTHSELLKQFEFSQSQAEKQYYIGEIAVNTDVSAKQDWFDIHAVAIFGEFKIPFSRFRNNILNNIREYVLPDQTIAILPAEWFMRYYELMFFSKKSDEKIRLGKHHFEIVNIIQDKKQFHFFKNNQSAEPATIPAEIVGDLRIYQQKGYAWLMHLYENNFGGCLADDMGLGKTIQTIALLQKIKNINKANNSHTQVQKYQESKSFDNQMKLFDEVEELPVNSLPSLIVMPTSLIHNWQNEFKKFAPQLKIHIYSGGKRLKSKDIYKVFLMHDVVLTTYGTLRNDIEILQNCTFHHLILDESQYVKNPDSVTYKSVKRVNSLHKLALTGTPVENSLNDLWAQLNIVNEGLLGSQSAFKNAYLNPINKNNKVKEEALLTIIKPFIFRRTKDEVAPELPTLSQETVYCDMSEEQQTEYIEEKNKLRTSLLFQDVNAERQNIAFLTLQGLTRLRLLANHPKLIDPDFNGESGKFEQIIMRFETLKSENHKVLIFSSFVKHLRLLSDYFDRESWKYSWLSGSTPTLNRESEINKFKTDPDVNCFFISLKAGGVGLNLTAADYVFIIDPWWNPAAEMQALSRSHRIGQDKKVMVYRFISTDSIEEKIRNLQESKSKLAQTFITSTNPLKDLNREEMVALLAT